MAKKPTVAALNAAIKRRDRIWKKSTPAQRRVLIAQDVIEQIKLKRIEPWCGSWVCGVDGPKHRSLQKAMLGGVASCSACALGAVMVSTILYRNKFNIDDTRDLDPDWLRGKQDGKLGSEFTSEQLKAIEIAFEKGKGAYVEIYGNQALAEAAVTFGNRYPKERNRLIAIMKNIIKNKGEFVP